VAIFAKMKKQDEDERFVRYLLDDGETTDRVVVFDKVEERIYSKDGNENGAFKGAARKLATAYLRDEQIRDAVSCLA
jgi:hypothetical protein